LSRSLGAAANSTHYFLRAGCRRREKTWHGRHDPMTDITTLAKDYFGYVATCFPVMCASDEFHFLPRARDASRHYDKLEDLSPLRISECLATLKQRQKICDLLAGREEDLETRIDLALLKANMAGLLIELETKAAWRHNPLLYLKIAFIGLDQALTKPFGHATERQDRVVARLNAIPRLLKQGADNITKVPTSYFQAALAMVNDCKAYVFQLGANWADTGAARFVEGLEKVRSSLGAFDRFLQGLYPVPDKHLEVVSALETTLREHFLCARTLSEIFEIAQEEWRNSLERLEALQAEIHPGRSWKALYDAYCPSEVFRLDTLSLYRKEIDSLKAFFQDRGFGDTNWHCPLELCETPTYLQSVRGSASFSAALGATMKEQDLFFLTPRRPHSGMEKASDLLHKRLHREYRFLSAHETFPGHHVLDSVRRSLVNPLRRQIESPLFYEGWASYAESLLVEYGYVDDPMEQLVLWKRRLWRAARCQIDVGLNTGRLCRGDAIELLTAAGFTTEEARVQIDRFRLNPGYQLCYTLGLYEIARLRAAFGSAMGRDQFHKALLLGGQLPFHMVEKRLEMRRRA